MSKRYLILFLGILLLASGCVSGPPTVSEERTKNGSDSNDSHDNDKNNEGAPPDWVLNRPQDDATFKYFVGSGSSDRGDQAEARSIAGGDMYSSIQRYIGVDVASVTESKARASLDSYKTSITQTITQTGAARVAGFEITKTWVDEHRKPAVTVYVLGRYKKLELQKEKANQEKLRDEALRAITGPEKIGLELVTQGKYYDAAKSFITAASNALNSKLPNKDIRFKRNIDHTLDAVDHINLVKLNDNLSGLVGNPLPEALRLKAASGGTATSQGIPNVKLEVTYRKFHKPTGKMRPESREITSDQDGYASFEHPIPAFVGSSSVAVSLILDTTVENLDEAPESQRELVDGLEERIARKKVVFKLQITSNAKNIKTGILIIDYESGGELAGITESSSAVKSALAGFNLTVLSLTRGEIFGKGEAELMDYLKGKFGNQVERILFGTVRIVSTSKSGKKILAKAAGTVQVLETKSGSILFTSQKQKSGMGNTEPAAVSSAYKSIGKLLGRDIRNNLK